MRNIHKSTPPSFRRRENAAAIVKAPPPGALTKGPDRKFPGFHPPLGGATSPPLLINRRFAFPIVALLAALIACLVLFSGGPVQAQVAAISLGYDENGTGPVFTFASRDPEGVVPPTIWSVVTDTTGIPTVEAVEAEDDDNFNISTGGVLTFESPPDYEEPEDQDTDNVYNVTVQASDGGVTEHLSWYKVVVTVRDVEEQGKVTWMVDPDGAGDVVATAIPQPLLQFQAGAMLTASVTDDDGNAGEALPDIAVEIDPAASLTWKWYRASSSSGPWAEVPEAILATYNVEDTSGDNDEGMYLRVVATYTDRRGARNTAEFVSQNPVQISREDNTDPVFGGSATRTIDENSRENIGAPVTASDADNDILTYSFDTGTGNDVGPDYSSFTIDPVTGQLKVRPELGLDFEAAADVDRGTLADEGDNDYVVTVRATDSKGGAGAADVTITVRDVNEAPTVTGEGMANDHAEDAAVALMTGLVDNVVAWKATATDPEGGSITWSLSGADEALFELTGIDDAIPTTAGLVFKAKPDFENPEDANLDNIYEVTVVASDGDKSGMRTVTVKVTNAVEAGKVSLTVTDPVVGTEITASLTDSDRVVLESVEWKWERADQNAFGADDNILEVGDEAAYTPKAVDADKFLRVQATYLDRTDSVATDTGTVETEAGPPAPEPAPTGFKNVKWSVVTTAVLDDPANQAPVFNEGPDDGETRQGERTGGHAHRCADYRRGRRR